MKKLIVFAVLLVFCGMISAQDYDWGVGVRLGDPSGISAKKYLGKNGIELSVGAGGYINHPNRGNGRYKTGGVTILCNYHFQFEIPDVEGLYWYVGPGGAMKIREFQYSDGDSETRVSLTAQGVAGMEYFLGSAPVSFFIDFMPGLEIFPNFFAFDWNAGIGARYNF